MIPTKEELAKIKRNMHPLQICDQVFYGTDSMTKKRASWRVSSCYKQVRRNIEDIQADCDGSIESEVITGVLVEDIQEEIEKRKQLGLPHTTRYKLIPCESYEATHVGLSSVGHATARIEDCEYIGKIDWSDEMIKSNIESWKRLIPRARFDAQTIWE